jgi:hydrogenase maturation protease
MDTLLPARHRVLVIGLGNEALGDDGIGVHVARVLASRPLPPHVQVREGGTAGYALVGWLEGVQRLVLVDAMAMGRPPGTVVAVSPDGLRRLAPADRSSLHGTSPLDALELAAALGLDPPETYIVGIQPAQVAWGLGLSPPLQQALPEAVEAVVRVIAHELPVWCPHAWG